MANRVSLALAIHNHQPVGNFGWVIQDVYEKAYLPLVDALRRHPGVRLSLHYTGPLLDWFGANHPDFIETLRTLVARGQVEMIGGGLYEPVLTSIPDRDRLGQLGRMADDVERLFGQRPQGAWLAERVWEPDLPVCLVDAGYAWTILDDHHFRGASIGEDALWGAYVTEDQGRLLRVFGTEQRLRYAIPFGQVEEVIAHLRDHATEDGHRLGFMGDDGEKFGAWPGTFEHCWGRTAWIERFFAALDANASWLTTVTPSDWLQREPPIGRMYSPTGSYIEMGEWALPADEANTYTELVRRATQEGLPERRWLRGGFWRNFQVRYREINDLHKQMLRTSAKVAAMPPGADRTLAERHLYQGQSNDCYWHGLFGGVYIVHMRLATLAHLIAAEDLADGWTRAQGHDPAPDPALPRHALAPDPGHGPGAEASGCGEAYAAGSLTSVAADGSQLVDTDLDGVDEVFLATPGQVVTVDLADGAGIGSWDLRAPRLALAAALRRRPEAYHELLIALERDVAGDGAVAAKRQGAAGGEGGEGGDAGASEAPRTIHDAVRVKENGLGRRIVYDRHERRSGLVHLVPPGTTGQAFANVTYVEWSDAVEGAYRVAALQGRSLAVERDSAVDAGDGARPVRVRKVLELTGERLDPGLRFIVEVENRSAGAVRTDLVVEWNINVAGGGGNPAAYYRVPATESGERLTHDSTGERAGVSALAFGNDHDGVDVGVVLDPPAHVAWYPIETVANSEAGFERSYQGSCLLLRWPLDLAPATSAAVRVDLDARCSRDALAEERP